MKQAFRNGIAALRIAAIVSMLIVPVAGTAHAGDAAATVVFIRHGEKPPAGLGQLDCQGLNRALALPAVVERMFGKPDAIFAPDPSGKNDDSGVAYDYVRPLATIEPTAITFGLPVDASIEYSARGALVRRSARCFLEVVRSSSSLPGSTRSSRRQRGRCLRRTAAIPPRCRHGAERLRQHVCGHDRSAWRQGKFRDPARRARWTAEVLSTVSRPTG